MTLEMIEIYFFCKIKVVCEIIFYENQFDTTLELLIFYENI